MKTFVEMKKTTRVGRTGKDILCPNCGNISTVYHLSWSALTCASCYSMVDKYSYQIEDNETRSKRFSKCP